MDAITAQYFDPSTVEIDDQTNGSFTDWFDGDSKRIARLSGAPRNSKVLITYWENVGFQLDATGPLITGSMVRRILQHDEEIQPVLFIKNVAFELPKSAQGQKIGVRSVAIELREAQLTGQFAYVEVNAAGNASTLNPDNPLDYLNGYVVWPQMGFDGPIPANRRADLHPCEMVSDVLKSVDGKSK
ncbi:hypothetical protein AVMA1855_24875 [Acidovorax sp. SUPP1855]|uniref:hypothetical protein n=1 Tax=Acidovorax sp. SUPP1855 TaxID=431774 RepID=UPI0023DE3E15|nr:hypothetical protein [Acidovorax sp. SUPP1855]GKS87449.1 hypothetical protein AVMA1855_24875 [Acidovorax sp. SUPP1855]